MTEARQNQNMSVCGVKGKVPTWEGSSKLSDAQQVTICPAFMQLEDSLSRHISPLWAHSEPDDPSPHRPTLLLQDLF
jgi:hypothetical protein